MARNNLSRKAIYGDYIPQDARVTEETVLGIISAGSDAQTTGNTNDDG